MDTQPAQERPVKSRRVVAGKSKNPNAIAGLSKPSVSVCDDVQVLIARRAYELHAMRGYPDGYALDDWLEAEREVLSQIPPA
jgi:Protein of unknown function (DUF2934)